MASSVIQVRINESLKTEATQIFHNLGLDMSSAIRLFLNRVILEQGLPFPMKLHDNEENDTIVTNKEDKHKVFDVVKYIENLSLENWYEILAFS